MSKSYYPDERIRELHDYLRNYKKQVRFDTIGSKLKTNPQPFDYIRYSSQAFLSGAIPNPDALLFITLALDKYIRSKGELSLDEAFELKSKPKAGNPSRQYAANNNSNNKLFDMACMRAAEKKLTIEKAAERVCADDSENKEQATLERKYKSKRWRDIEAILRGK